MAAVHREAKGVKTEGWKIRRAGGGRKMQGVWKLRNGKSPKMDALWGGNKNGRDERRSEGKVMVGIERMRAIPPRRQDSPQSGPTEDCQGLNDITLHVIYFTGPGWVYQVTEDAYNPDCGSSAVATTDPQTHSAPSWSVRSPIQFCTPFLDVSIATL